MNPDSKDPSATRRDLLLGGVVAAAAVALPGCAHSGAHDAPEPAAPGHGSGGHAMGGAMHGQMHGRMHGKPHLHHAHGGTGMLVTADGTKIFYKDWGSGAPIVFSHGWPLQADSWDDQMYYLASNGFRCIAHDRRGHGRSSQPWDGNDMDHYADDLAALIEALDLQGAVLVGFSTGGGEVARYIGRHGTGRVKKAALCSAIPPLMLKTPANPGGLPKSVFDDLRRSLLADRAQTYRNLADGPFYGANRPGAKVSPGVRDEFWRESMQCGLKAAHDCIAAFSETDTTEDLKKFDVPTLILHGDDDQIVPIGASALMASKLVKNATLKVYEGAPHGLAATHQARFNADLLAFVKSG